MKDLVFLLLILLCLLASPRGVRAQDLLKAKEQASLGLCERLRAEERYIYVYHDYSDAHNHFTQRSLTGGGTGNVTLEENWQEAPQQGDSCIRCLCSVPEGGSTGFLFLNGYLDEETGMGLVNDGLTKGQGVDLTGTKYLTFYARGEEGGEKLTFFVAGFGYQGESSRPYAPYPDSSKRISLSLILGRDWQSYRLPLAGEDLKYIACGFGFEAERDSAFYLDEIRFEGDYSLSPTLYPLLRSYDTQEAPLKNAAFTYDNALAAMALLSEGKKEEAKRILDALVFAVSHDRYQEGMLRNAYVQGSISPFPGWGSSARLPGWYDASLASWQEDGYQVGTNPGNCSFVALALLHYDHIYPNEDYVRCAAQVMDRVIGTCRDENPGFLAGSNGWPEQGESFVETLPYKSTEHNLDIYAACRQLYEVTREEKYQKAAESALSFLLSMKDPAGTYFYTGTLSDGETPRRDITVLDAQVWTALALGKDMDLKEVLTTIASMEREGGYPFALGEGEGFWSEGTAFTALLYRTLGEEEKADRILEEMIPLQGEDGFFFATSTDHLSTGLTLSDGSPWEYEKVPHLAPTAWFILAANGFNPFCFEPSP